MNIRVRIATKHDRNAIRRIHSLAFPQQESALIADLADRLLDEESDPASVTLVAVIGDEIVGHVAFSPVYASADSRWLGYILAPLAVAPTHHGHGIGSQLVRTGIERLAEQGTRLFLVYGDPAYYGRFGFRAEAASGLLPPYDLEYPSGWLALPLERAAIGKQPVQLTCVAPLQDPALW
ncbi:MAG: N-acetyltransferase [Gammaproteobacteria bacterium]|nr:N-acetyltransferase [Gammaproteobacteria bacterium]